jgi:hypothetical protein
MQRTVAAAAGAPGAAVIRARTSLQLFATSGGCPGWRRSMPPALQGAVHPHQPRGCVVPGRTSRKERKPVAWMAVWCTKMSSLPSSGVMKPNPLTVLNHFTCTGGKQDGRKVSGRLAAPGSWSTTTAVPTTLQRPTSPPQSIATPRALPAFLMSAMTASEADLLSDAWKKGFLEETRSRRRRPRHHSPRSCGSGSRGPGSVQVSLGSHCDAPDTATSAPDLAP